MKQTITAVIPALNEEKNIERCIKSVLWCDRVIVLWMGKDKTDEIAKKLGATVVKKNPSDKDDFTLVQKNINWTIDTCKTDWILRVDADEVVTEELRDEITEVINQKNCEYIAYGIPRAPFFWGQYLTGGDWIFDRLIRLFKPQYCRYDPIVAVHEQFRVTGEMGYLNQKLLHFSHPTLHDAVVKFQKYTDVEIHELKDSKLSAFFKLICNPPYVFFRWMFWHHGYRDGIRGIVAGAMRGWYEYLLYSKFLKSKLTSNSA